MSNDPFKTPDINVARLRPIEGVRHQFLADDPETGKSRLIVYDPSNKVEEAVREVRRANRRNLGTGKTGARYRLKARLPAALVQAFPRLVHDEKFLEYFLKLHPEYRV